MTVSATRFTALTEDFNAPIASISTADPKQIINSGSNSVSSITNSILNTVRKISSQLSVVKSATNAQTAKNRLSSQLGITKALGTISQVEDSIRQVRGLMKTMLGSTGSGSNSSNKLISSVFPTSVQNSVKTIESSTDNGITSDITTGKPFNPTITLPGGSVVPGTLSDSMVGNEGSDYTQLADVINQLSSKNYNATVVDNNAILRQIVTIGNAAYNANMTGVIAALKQIPNATDAVVARATAIILTEQASKGNSSAVIDISNSGILGGTNSPIHASPSIISDTISNFTLPTSGKQQKYDSLVDALLSSLSSLDPTWNVSSYDNIPSTQYVSTVSSDLKEALEVKATNHIFAEEDIETTVFDSDDDLVIAAMIGTDPKISSILRTMAIDSA